MFKTRSKGCCLLLLFVAVIALSDMGEAYKHICPKNEFYTDCGDNCQTTCSTLYEKCNIVHIKCPEGCYCNKGYARDAYGVCIPISQCPLYADRRICPKNEFYTDCGDNCQTLCSTLYEECTIIHKKCPEGCYCNKGYARDADGICIPIGRCPIYY